MVRLSVHVISVPKSLTMIRDCGMGPVSGQKSGYFKAELNKTNGDALNWRDMAKIPKRVADNRAHSAIISSLHIRNAYLTVSMVWVIDTMTSFYPT